MSVINVAIATDRAYLPWSATTMMSCLRSTPNQQVHFHVFHLGDLSADDQRQLSAMVADNGGAIDVQLVGDLRLPALPSKGDDLGGLISWMRVLMPDLLPDVDRLVYLDADTLIVDTVAPLAALPLHGNALAAVPNVINPAMRYHVAELGLRDTRSYFNAGVLVMDLAHMRQHATSDQIVRYVSTTTAKLDWFDQDALNVVLADEWLTLHPRWNAQNSFWAWTSWARDVFSETELREAMTSPAILHFEGPALNKPWHYLCPSPFRDQYRRTAAATPWPDEPLQDRSVINRVIARLPTQWRIPAYVRAQRLLARVGRSRL